MFERLTLFGAAMEVRSFESSIMSAAVNADTRIACM